MRRASLFSGALIFIILAVWESACRGFNIPDFILPPPSQILTVAVVQVPLLLPHAQARSYWASSVRISSFLLVSMSASLRLAMGATMGILTVP